MLILVSDIWKKTVLESTAIVSPTFAIPSPNIELANSLESKELFATIKVLFDPKSVVDPGTGPI